MVSYLWNGSEDLRKYQTSVEKIVGTILGEDRGCLVTDKNRISDFYVITNVDDIDEEMKRISKILGIDVRFDDYLKDIAKKLSEKNIQ